MSALRPLVCLALASLTGCLDAGVSHGPDDAPIVARIRAEPAEATCAAGGRTVLGGPDLDGDGALDDDEVVTTDPLCAVGDGERAELLAGAIAPRDVIIDSTTTPEQLAEYAQLQLIRGALTIQDGARVELPALELVRGGLVINGTVHQVALPRLDEVSGDVRIAGTSLAGLELGALTTIGGALAIVDTGEAPLTIALPGLVTVGGHVNAPETGSLEAPRLAEIGGSLILEGAPTAIALPALTSIGGLLGLGADVGRLDLASLSHVGALALTYPASGDVSLPALAAIDRDLEMFAPDITALSLPQLTRVGGTMLVKDAHQYGGLHVTRLALPRLESLGQARVLAPTLKELDLRALRSADGLSLTDLPSLTSLQLPDLSSIDTLQVAMTGITSLDLAALERVSHLDLYGNPALTVVVLERVTALDSLRIAAHPRLFAVGAHALTGGVTAEIDISDNPALASIGAPLQTAAKVTLSGLAITDLQGLSALTSVGAVIVTGNPRLTTSAGLGALTTAGSIELRDNAVLTTVADLPRCKALTGNLIVVGNAKLTGVAGLKAVTRIDGAVSLERNAAMKKLTGLDKLVQIGRGLRIVDNAALENLGLPLLRAVGATATIKSNPKLPAAERTRVLKQITPPSP